MSIENDMNALESGTIKEPETPKQQNQFKSKYEQNEAGGSIYEPLKIAKDTLPAPLNYYSIGGWFKPGTSDHIEVCKKAAGLLKNKGYTLRLSMGELNNPMTTAMLETNPTVSMIRPFPTYEPKDIVIPEPNISSEKIDDDIARICAAYDPKFNISGRGYQIFSMSRVAALLGGSLKTPVKYLCLHTWDREKDAGDITHKTNAAVATTLRIVDDAGIKVVNFNDTESLSSFVAEIKKDYDDDVSF